MIIRMYMILLQLAYFKAIHCQTCSAQDIASHYAQLSSISKDPIRNDYAKIVTNNCLFGKGQSLADLNHCYKHCSLRENCVAIYTSNEGSCRMCYNGTEASNYDDFNHDNMFIRLEVLETRYQNYHSQPFSGCSAEDEEIHVGDFDGNGRNELLCRNM